MTELLPYIPTLILAFLLWRAERRSDEEQKAWRLERLGLIEHGDQEKRHLMDRIQAPERAVLESYESPEMVQAVGFDNDEEFWAEKEKLNGDS
jgi:hypothetical protein